MRHFLVPASALNGASVILDGDDARHLVTVLRQGVGDEMVVACEGSRYRCRIISASSLQVEAEVVELLPPPPSLTPVTLVQGVPKGKKMDDIVRMATEIGVDRIVPLRMERSEVDPSPAKLERWRAIAHAADKQSRSLRFTTVTDPGTDKTLETPDGLKLLLWEGSAPSLRSVVDAHSAPPHVTILIGPEGGVSDNEYERLTDDGFLPVSLGPKIVRTETAGIAALASLRTLLEK